MNRLGRIVATFVLGALQAGAQGTLKDAYKDQFRIGAALEEAWFDEKKPALLNLIPSQFNTISPANVLKWGATEPRPGEYHFAAADRYVAYGERHKMFIIGHTLVWHSQIPEGVFKNDQGGPADRATLLARMRDHIRTLVGRYKGRIQGWDVVNEGLAEDGTLRDSPWHRIIGDDYIAKAFEYAHEADPQAELYYNDYGIESGSKHTGALTLLKNLKAAGVPITGVGIQEHVNLTWPTTRTLDQSIADFGRLGLKVEISELDVDVLPASSMSTVADVGRREAASPALNPYAHGLPDRMQQKLARRYADLFGVYLKNRALIGRVTMWGVTDGDSWLNNWPIPGRTSYPLLFDRAGRPKPALAAVIERANASLDASGDSTNPAAGVRK